MANVATLFVDPAGNYTGGYTSEMIECTFKNHRSNQTRGVIQADIEPGGKVYLQVRMTVNSRWIEIAIYDEDIIEEIVMAHFLRVVVIGDAKVWLGEVR